MTLDQLVERPARLQPAESEPRFPLAMQGISKRWGHLQVLDDIDLELQSGRLTWIGGANGVGKTTLLRIAAGLIGADSGFVHVDEKLHPERNRRDYLRRIGYLSAGNGALYARLSARRQLDFAACIAFIPRSERRKAIERALSRYGLEELADQRVDRMSMGQRQRVRLAMSLVHSPAVLLLDEPFNSLDEEGIEVFREAIADTLVRGGTALVCAPGGLPLPIGHDEHYRLVQGKLVPE